MFRRIYLVPLLFVLFLSLAMADTYTIMPKQAEKLLRNDKHLSVQDVATLTGFASVSNFVKRFREMYGVNPSQMSQK